MANLFEDAKPEDVSFEERIACVDRELKMRAKVYPRWVVQGKIKQEAADREIMAMRGVRHSLVVHRAVELTLGCSDGTNSERTFDHFMRETLDRFPEPVL